MVLFDTLIIFLKELFEKVILKKKSTDKNNEIYENYQACKEIEIRKILLFLPEKYFPMWTLMQESLDMILSNK